MDPQDRALLEQLAARGRWVDALAFRLQDVATVLGIAAGALLLGRAVYREGLREGVARGMRRSREELDVGTRATP